MMEGEMSFPVCISKARHFSFYCHEHKPTAALSRSTARMQGSYLHCWAAADCQTSHQPIAGLGPQQHLPAPQVCCAVLALWSPSPRSCLHAHLCIHISFQRESWHITGWYAARSDWSLQQGYNGSSRVDYPTDITYIGFFFLAFEAVLAALCQLQLLTLLLFNNDNTELFIYHSMQKWDCVNEISSV